MNKHDEQFAETLRQLSAQANSFDKYVSIWMLEELHEIHTSLDNICYTEAHRED